MSCCGVNQDLAKISAKSLRIGRWRPQQTHDSTPAGPEKSGRALVDLGFAKAGENLKACIRPTGLNNSGCGLADFR
jgi:hypothetical protein